MVPLGGEEWPEETKEGEMEKCFVRCLASDPHTKILVSGVVPFPSPSLMVLAAGWAQLVMG